MGTNKGVLIPKLKYGFEICGLELHENYGAMIKLVYHFHIDRKRLYYNKYGHMKNDCFIENITYYWKVRPIVNMFFDEFSEIYEFKFIR